MLQFNQALFDAVSTPIFIIDRTCRFAGANRAFLEFVGKSPEELLNTGVYRCIAQNNSSEYSTLDHELMKRGTSSVFEGFATDKGDVLHSVVYKKAPVRDESGEVTGLVTTLDDLSQLKETEKALASIEAQRQAIFDGFPGVLALLDKDLKVIWGNEQLNSILPLPMGKSCHHIFCEEKDRCMGCAIPDSFVTGEVCTSIQQINQRGGKEVVYEITGTPVKDLSGEFVSVVMIARDVTENFKLEKQLRYSQKMEAIGTLAGGIAHDFNNVLTPIMGYSEMLRLKFRGDGGDDDTREYLDEILRAAKRAKSLVEQILTFSRSNEEKEVLQDIHPIIKEVMKLMRITLPSTINVTLDIDEECGQVSVDPVQIHQILINLCTNSSQALAGRQGSLNVRLAKAEIAESEQRWLELCVSDDGPGISPEIIDRIFEPYFTTKEKGQGTGMGLSMVHGIVTRQGGRIKVESTPGQGASFHVFLPVFDTEINENEHVVFSEKITGGSENILLVDDEEQVVKITSELLASLGYNVIGAASSVEALQVFAHAPESFDLLLTDLTMPVMNGLELCEKIKTFRPDLPVVLCSGYSENISRDAVKNVGVTEYCLKPISLRDLARTVRQALESVAEVC